MGSDLMADVSIFYPGSDDHPVDEALVARGLDYRAFNPELAMSNVAHTLADWTQSGRGFSSTATTLSLPDGSDFTPSGAGITPENADTRYIRYDEAQPGITQSQQIQFRTNAGLGTAAVRDEVFFDITKTGDGNYVSVRNSGGIFRDIVVDPIDLTEDVTGMLPVANINATELNERIVQQAATVGSVHQFADMAAFSRNTDTWQVGDVVIIGDVTYLYIATNGATSTDINDFQRITVTGGALNQATADGRYGQLSNNLSDLPDAAVARMNLGLGNAAILDTGTAPGTVATGDHNHDTRYARFDEELLLSGPQRQQFFSNVGAFSGTAYLGVQLQDFNAATQGTYALGRTPMQRTSTLPTGITSAEISYVNLSTLNPATPAMRQENVPAWRIVPATGERINGLPVDEELIIDDAIVNFTLTYTDADTGWVIK